LDTPQKTPKTFKVSGVAIAPKVIFKVYLNKRIIVNALLSFLSFIKKENDSFPGKKSGAPSSFLTYFIYRIKGTYLEEERR
jgi:hypothetical protein